MSNDFYCVEWDDVARVVKEAACWRCQECGIQCRKPGEEFDSHKRTLTVAHLDQRYDGPVVTVAALCVPCHLAYDAPFGWWARRRWEQFRQRQAGQLPLLIT